MHSLGRPQDRGELGEPLPASLRAGHRRSGERLCPVADTGAKDAQVQGGQRRGRRRDDRTEAARARVLVLLAVAHRPACRDSRLPRPEGLDVLVAALTVRHRPVVEVGRRQGLVPEHPVGTVTTLRNAEEHRVQVQDLVRVVEQVELLEPPAVGGAVPNLRAARQCPSPRGELGGALDEDHPRVVLGDVVQGAARGGAVTLGPGDTRFELRVVEIEQRQALLVRPLGVGLRVVDAGDSGDQEVGGGQVAGGVVVGGLGVDQVRDPVLGVRVVRLVDRHLVGVVVGGHDRGEAGEADALGQASETGEQVDRDEVVMAEAAAADGGPVSSGAGAGLRLAHGADSSLRSGRSAWQQGQGGTGPRWRSVRVGRWRSWLRA